MNTAAALLVTLVVLMMAFGLYANLKQGSVPSRHRWLDVERSRQPIVFWAFMALRAFVIVSAGFVLWFMLEPWLRTLELVSI